MGLRIRFVVLIALIALVTPAFAQDRAAEAKLAFDRAQHLRQGINASEWFAQEPGHYSARDTGVYIDDADIALMAQIGFDSVRLSIDAQPLEEGRRNKEGFNADFIGRLDHVVDQMAAHAPERPPEGRDHPGGHGGLEPERAPDRDRQLPDLELRRVAEGGVPTDF